MENTVHQTTTMERREADRPRVRLAIVLTRHEQQHEGETEDLSLGGARIRAELEPALQVGERVRLRFELPDLQSPVEAEAEVRWVSQIDPRFAGVQFTTGFRAIETWALTRLLAQAAPQS